MKTFDSPQTEAAMRRLVLARVVAGVIVVFAVVLAPQVTDSVATLPSSKVLSGQMDDGGAPSAYKGIGVQETTAAPVEPLSMSY